jgi:hypothetical protein
MWMGLITIVAIFVIATIAVLGILKSLRRFNSEHRDLEEREQK